MKKLFTSVLLVLLVSASVFCQPPQAFKYQAVVRNSSGDIVQNQTVGVRINIRDVSAGGTIIYQESHTMATNDYGVLNLNIGSGTPTIGTFSSIVWRTDAKYIEVLVDITGGTNYISMGSNELLSVPYAQFAKNSLDSYWTKNGSNIYYPDGNIGIGATSPQYRMDIYAPGTTSTGIAAFRNSLGESKIILRQNSNGCGSVNIYNASQVATAVLQGDGISYFNGGYLGIGTNSPTTNLTVKSSGYTHGVYVNSSDDQLIFRVRQNSDESGSIYVYDGSGVNTVLFSGAGNSYINSGRLGIGTTSPGAGLHIVGDAFPNSFLYLQSDASEDAGIRLYESSTAKWHIFNNSTLGGLQIYNTAAQTVFFANQSGNVGIGTTSPASRLDVMGNVTIRNNSGDIAVELGTGLDYAEGFDVTDKTGIEPGTVLCIDSENPGNLIMSSEEYDTKVAGIVAGANNLGTGISLGGDIHDFNVALAGRVYCNVDASSEAVAVGDLLTTSSVQGYAMKVKDSAQAQGAILGKAMQGLAKGEKGLILVLVTLQ